MKPIPLTAELVALAPRVIWFETPEKALADLPRFLAYLMTYGAAEDIQVARRYWNDDDFLAALDQAPPGIIDARSWWYWNAILGRHPPPPMPQRRLPD